LALGTYWLLEDGSSAQAWIRWAREKAIAAGAVADDGAEGAPEAMPRPRPAIAAAPAPPLVPAAAGGAPLEGVVLDAAQARKLARDQRFRESPDGIMMRAMADR
jgi:hypothetical protein